MHISNIFSISRRFIFLIMCILQLIMIICIYIYIMNGQGALLQGTKDILNLFLMILKIKFAFILEKFLTAGSVFEGFMRS